MMLLWLLLEDEEGHAQMSSSWEREAAAAFEQQLDYSLMLIRLKHQHPRGVLPPHLLSMWFVIILPPCNSPHDHHHISIDNVGSFQSFHIWRDSYFLKSEVCIFLHICKNSFSDFLQYVSTVVIVRLKKAFTKSIERNLSFTATILCCFQDLVKSGNTAALQWWSGGWFVLLGRFF